MMSLLVGFVLGFSSTLVLYFMNFNQFFSRLFKKSIDVMNSNSYKMVLVVRMDLNMGKGKIAAQCCHAALGCYKQAEKSVPQYVQQWIRLGQPKIVVKLDNKDDETKLYELSKMARRLGVPCSVVHDAGHTQVASGTATVAGLGPAPTQLLDQITGNFKLL